MEKIHHKTLKPPNALERAYLLWGLLTLNCHQMCKCFFSNSNVRAHMLFTISSKSIGEVPGYE
jgi:hypothetical protein